MRRLIALLLAAFVAAPAFGAGAFVTANNSVLYLTSSLPGDPVSATAWVQNTVNGDNVMFHLNDGTNNIWLVYGRIFQTSYRMLLRSSGCSDNYGGGGDILGSSGAWHFIALRRSGTTYEVYVDGLLTTEVTLVACTTTAGAATRFAVGARRTTSATATPFTGSIAAVKVWNAYLTPEQLQNERWSYRPKTTTGFYMWSPLLNGADSPTLDFTGGGHAMTNVAVTNSTSGPPISW